MKSGSNPNEFVRASSLAVGLAAALLVATGCAKPPAVEPPPEVLVTPAVEKDVPVFMELVGQTAGSVDVEIRARVEGYLETVNFREGQFVRAGELLYTIDPKPFEATVSEKQADVATAQAKLVQAEQEVTRLGPLAKQQAISQRDFDNAVSNRDAAKAQLDAAKSALEKAQLDLGYTRISAPIAGLVGLTKLKPGNLVGRGDSTLLTTISATDPLFFTASITEADYLRFMEKYKSGEMPDKKGDKQLLELILANGETYPERGQMDAIQRAVDTKTGTLAIRAKFPNPQRVLRPGQYGRVRFVVDTLIGAVCVPQKAIQELQGVQQVVVVGADRKAEVRTVKTGPKIADLWVITDGVKAGENVVVEGAQKARPGMEVQAKPAGTDSGQGTGAAGAAPGAEK